MAGMRETMRGRVNMSLTEKQKQDYLKHSTLCPYCGSNDISCIAIQVDNQSAWQDCECLSCNKSWTDIFTLTDIQESSDK